MPPSPPESEASAEVRLTAGKRYRLRLEFADISGAAVCRLLWSGPSTPKSVIPSSQLSPG